MGKSWKRLKLRNARRATVDVAESAPAVEAVAPVEAPSAPKKTAKAPVKEVAKKKTAVKPATKKTTKKA